MHPTPDARHRARRLARRDTLRRLVTVAAAGSPLLAACSATPPAPLPQRATVRPPPPSRPPVGAVISGFASHEEQALGVHLLNRLGFGPRPGDLEAMASMGVDRWIDQQLSPERLPAPPELGEPLAQRAWRDASQGTLVAAYLEAQRTRADQGQPAVRDLVRSIQRDARAARLRRALDGPAQLQEVLVDFWFNHFNVFGGKDLTRVLVGRYEDEAIRPHVFGRFRDLLGAVVRHPAMLVYLDNAQSVAPGFRPPAALSGGNPLAAQRISGLNENHARELMELHTLGVDGGYTQADVTELARVLTGWTIDRRAARGDVFRFVAARHDDGQKRLLGQAVPGRGIAEGEWALDLLARHPATARHLAYKLAQAFVADAPPPALVRRLADVFTRTDGDLRATTRALATSAELRDPSVFGAKFKTPYHFVLSSVRATGLPVSDTEPLAGWLAQMGMPLYGCPTPDGWKNTREAWLGPEALAQRVEFASALGSGRLGRRLAASGAADAAGTTRPDGDSVVPDERALLQSLREAIGIQTRETVAAAAPAMRAALILGSPDFMRR